MSFIAAAVIGGVASLAGGLISSNAASKAAGQQANAENNALGVYQNQFNTVKGELSPYINAGDQSLEQLNYLLGNGSPGQGQSSYGSFGSLLQPFTAQYMQQYSPAYQFQRAQGEYGTLAGNSSGQGALSGAAQQGLESYNQQFANTAFNNAFQQYNTQQNNIYDRLAGIARLGQAGASSLAGFGTNLAGQEGQTLSNIGTAQAGGTIGSANALSGAISNAGNLGSIYALMGGGGGSFQSPSIADLNSEGSDATGQVNSMLAGMPT